MKGRWIQSLSISELYLFCFALGKKVWNEGLTNETDKRVRKNNEVRKGYKHTEKAKRKMSESSSGEKSGTWKGGLSFKPYDSNFTTNFKKFIRERDNQICLLCNIHREKLKKALAVHHIDYNKQNTCKENCCVLCTGCNTKVNFNREEWTVFFHSLLNKRYGYIYGEVK